MLRPIKLFFMLSVLGIGTASCQDAKEPTVVPWTGPNLCGRPTPVRILAIGDAYVSGVHISGRDFGGTVGAFRTLLWDKLSRRGAQVHMVGTRCNGPEAYGPAGIETDRNCAGYDGVGQIDFVRSHQGLPGWTLENLLVGNGPALTPPETGNVQTWIAGTQPDIVVLMPGPADLSRKNNERKSYAQYVASVLTSQYIKTVQQAAPNAHILVLNHPPVGRPGRGNEGWLQLVRWYNDEMLNVLAADFSAGLGQVKLLDIFPLLDRQVDVSEDGGSPGPSGYEKIARALEDQIAPMLCLPLPGTVDGGAGDGSTDAI